MSLDAMDGPEGNGTSTEVPLQPDQPNEDLKFLVIPIVVVVIVMVMSALVYCMARRKRYETLRENILSLYDMDMSNEEWDSINSYDHVSYESTDHTTTSF